MMHRRTGATMAALCTVATIGLGVASASATAGVAAGKSGRTQPIAQTGAVPGGFASWTELLSMQERLARAMARTGQGGGDIGELAAKRDALLAYA